MNWYDAIGRWSDAHRSAVDIIMTGVLLAVIVPFSAATGSGEFLIMSEPNGPALGVMSFFVIAPLAVRRTHPVLSVVLVYGAILGHQLLGVPLIIPADIFVLVALFSVTVYGPRWAHQVAITSGLFGCFLLGVFIGVQGDMLNAIAVTTVLTGSMFLATWAFGLVRRVSRSSITALRDRALRLEIERDQQAQIATAAERSRIAREMHDIVAHSLSVMIAQADGGRYMAAAEPEAATRTLGTIAETGRAALADMRRLLGVLRSEPGDPGAGEHGGTLAGLAPQPAASDIETLVAQVRASGLRISLVRMGVARTLPPGTGLTLYRICQEALTNILKHAGPDPTVTVVLTWGPRSVQLQVDDDGRGASANGDGAGQGLLGMRERAAMFGGTVVSGPRPGGGFRVMLDLPLPEQRTDPVT
ncbi:Signal transduction histidine kinase [Sanguibacter gelidistatuariae]|uniref:histidine kinase n=1 Tax=Sanguibacter gelidistatuariae TaxID=1814289 RepID=A0A1G6QMZ3_9MICO|nr:sensor histidine kinase [Sanguibacter gelidistatuariae]SDC93434.1 Signal transduction histidine kinase [Sanguibacter gelidistatuariae]